MRPNALSLSLALCLALPAAASFAQTSAAEHVAPERCRQDVGVLDLEDEIDCDSDRFAV